MNLRARLIRPFSGLLWLAVAAPASGAAVAQPVASGAVQRFRFDAGAPLAAAAEVAPDGSVCVGTVDGYVHVLGPDGSYRWSRSLHGAVTRRPHFVGQRWFIATSAQRVYALNRDGSLSWVFKLYSAVESELDADSNGTLYFVAADHFLYGLSARGAVTLRTRFHLGMKPELALSAPDSARDSEGNAWRGRSDGTLEYQLASGEDIRQLSLTSSPILLPAWSSSARLIVASTRSGLVFGLDPARIRASH